ncbi:unnamed protein product [Phytophthora fragariaefolia]|uniref:Large ribosomal subunit protein uL23m n=1 Tax=Phytophthora fragariaefolia TaxID=1490495 RepID=A0A9W6TIQ9_9STRA|nr:unnamed protein product [Phytophthora fragariaefolia]
MVWNRVKFPNMAVTFMGKNARTRLRDNQFVFRVEPHYTKHEIKEYLTKVYDLPVAKVNTMNYEGAWAAAVSMAMEGDGVSGLTVLLVLLFVVSGKFKRAFRGRYVYKEKDWKKAIVTLKE